MTRTRTELGAALAEVRERGGRVGLVPTMGALHEGHRSLIATARELVGSGTARELVGSGTARELVGSGTARELVDSPSAVVVSIFVNPLQFGVGEDLASYPRTFDADLAICAAEDVDVVFAPGVEEVYPAGEPQVTVEPGPRGRVLEGSSRPTHFRGVLTVVAKLFGLVRPDLAVFGQKDYQQLVLIRQMVTDLCLAVEIVGAETVRDGDGLAISSRNSYLDADQRVLAAILFRAMGAGAEAGQLGADQALSAAREQLRDAVDRRLLTVNYLELTSVDLRTPPLHGPARLLVAARLGTTRLIDNTALVLGGRP